MGSTQFCAGWTLRTPSILGYLNPKNTRRKEKGKLTCSELPVLQKNELRGDVVPNIRAMLKIVESPYENPVVMSYRSLAP